MNKIIFFPFILLTQFTFGQTKQFDEVLNYYNLEKNFNGSIIVATDGKIDYLKSIGLLDRQEKKNQLANKQNLKLPQSLRHSQQF